ncbi:MAG: HNH endonuclease signature motif containing protein [Sphingomonas phyllosphaerae]|uniref:HNH endonuclease signature motif containing protein n=1 Tax=Sphingomonas phyllosphaerae TaxID=257003 RepID=UPI002FFCE6F3
MAWPTTSRHARGYGTAHDKMRAHLLATVITCEECARRGRETLGTIADHIKPLAQGGTGDRSNYQLLCQDCSDAKTLADKGQTARRSGGVGRDGRPTSADHPWNRN